MVVVILGSINACADLLSKMPLLFWGGGARGSAAAFLAKHTLKQSTVSARREKEQKKMGGGVCRAHKKRTALTVPRWSPTLVLSEPDEA